ncbi:uncharacterized protein SRS1_13772 [Sporisorium reilianum f. sp. reilianum]|uniref:Uncharacterized protein n=1 Tax=Sporisorium reilianum f. sp. reilianum TaxID=72559 RepID=A0A2N8UDX2_9BASI|nr:uncharacterized protein SRS1_13772 [Sporisorium reilianum f. sp. reilianum]
MDADPDFDYEMEPQTAYAAFPSSAEDAMDELSSEGVPMSDVGVRFEPVDKAAIDVDFYDPATLPKTDTHLPDPTASSTHIESEEIIESIQEPPTVHDDTGATAQVLDDTDAQDAHEVATKAGAHAQHNGAAPLEASDKDADHLDGAEQSQVQIIEIQTNGQEGQEHDELQQGEDGSASNNGAALEDQLDDDGEGGAQPGDDQGQGVNGDALVEEEQDAAIRVTFHGQDFVMWSGADIPAFLAIAHAVDSDDESEEVVQIEAPALEVVKDVLWQPLDSLFASLRDKKALGDFLDEAHELHIAFPDLDLDVAEDNLYCREITLDDLFQLHHGLGLATSLHIHVSERPRFITKYNELAQHVAGILGHQLQHSSDDEEEAANNGHSLRNAHANVEAVYESVGSKLAGEELGGEHVVEQIDTTSRIQQGVPLQSEEQAPPLSQLDNTKAQGAEDGPDAHQEGAQHELETQELDGAQNEEDDEEGVDELAGELQGEQEAEQGEGDEQNDAAQVTVREGDHQVDLAEDAEDLRHTDEDADDEEAQEQVDEGDEDAENLQGDQGEYEAEDDQGEGDEEYEEYDDGLGDNGKEAEQTFYTSVNDSSDAEEDELEEPEQGTPQNSALVQPAEDPASTYAYEAAENEPEWQGTFDSTAMTGSSELPADHRHFATVSLATSDQGEEQIVEYTEEQGEAVLTAASPTSTVSTSYTTGAQRKRGLDVEEDDEALYEQDDYEAESKRVKVD